MAVFCLKKLEPLIRVGERLKKTRQQQKLSLEDISKKTRIPIKYLEAIESARFKELPQAKAHRLAYIRQYAETLNLNPASFLHQFSQESDLYNYKPAHPLRVLRLWRMSSLSNLFRYVALGVLTVGFVSYLSWQVNGILQPPKLAVFSPIEGYISNKPVAIVQGETEKEVRLTVNGKEAMANNQGRFEVPIDLSNGVNTITISAIKKHGKTTMVTRHIIVKSNNLTVKKIESNF